jgi:penicillin amidase
LAVRLLEENVAGWFEDRWDDPDVADSARELAIIDAFYSALVTLQIRLGPDMLNWSWGVLHTLQQKHVLSERGELGQLLDRGGVPVRGDYVTVCNTGLALDYSAPTGAGYRLIADLSDPQGGLWAVDAGSESGHPGSPHYDDQLGDWLAARYHYLPLKREGLATSTERELILSSH